MTTLMIVDDEQLERQALRFLLERHCEDITIVGEAGDGASAVALAVENKPDIILMDIRMPQVSGLEAARQIRELLPDTRIVMLTAFDEFNYAKQAVSMGASEYLLKPVRSNELFETLEKVKAGIVELKNKRQQEETLRKTVEQALPFIQMAFVYDLLSGSIDDLGQCQSRADFLELTSLPNMAMVINIDEFRKITSRFSELEKQAIKQRVHATVNKIACAATGIGNRALVAPVGGDAIVVLIGVAGASEAAMKQEALNKAEAMRTAVAEAVQVNLTIGVGRCYDDPRDLYKSYQEAQSALRQRFYLGGSQVIHIEDVPHLNQGAFSYPFPAEREVLDKVRCGDRKQAKATLKALLETEILSRPVSIETIKSCALELLIVLSRAAVEGGANVEQLTLLNLNGVQALNDCLDKEAVEKWVMEAVDHFLDNMLENRNSMNLRVINTACDYIVAHCSRNLPLEEVAQEVHLSPFYFSRLFKKEKGYNFADFITQVRLDRAKKLLRDPDNTVVRIASDVGYKDASYFCRVFRQITGMTPNQYRQELRNETKERAKG